MENELKIKRLENRDEGVVDILLNHHYLKRLPTARITYGLFKKDALIGVASYGLPSAPLTKKFQNKVIELVRLFTYDEYKKDVKLSWFLTKTIKMLKVDSDYEFVISFAQLNANHIGAIYQATSGLYTGLTKAQNDYKIRGAEKKHPRGVLSNLKVGEIRQILGDLFYTLKRPVKARYIFPLIKRKKAIPILTNMGYKLFPYMKLDDEVIKKQIEIDMAVKKVANNYDPKIIELVKRKINEYKKNKSEQINK